MQTYNITNNCRNAKPTGTITEERYPTSIVIGTPGVAVQPTPLDSVSDDSMIVKTQ